MYEDWMVTRWETPVADIRRLLLVSLVDAGRELTLLLEDTAALERTRWRVRFRDYPAYRNIDEKYRLDLWRRLDESGQRCGSTFTVEEASPLASWGTGYLHEVSPDVRHFVIATDDDVVEVLSCDDPLWEVADPAQRGDTPPGKSRRLYIGEHDAEIAQVVSEIKRRNRPT